jgi:hypothetical protein
MVSHESAPSAIETSTSWPSPEPVRASAGGLPPALATASGDRRAGGGPVPLAQRREDPERGHQRAAAEVGDLACRLHRRAAPLTREPEQADEAEVVHVVPRRLALGASLAVA